MDRREDGWGSCVAVDMRFWGGANLSWLDDLRHQPSCPRRGIDELAGSAILSKA